MGEIYPFIMPFIRLRSTIFVERNLNLPLLTLTLNFNSHLRPSAIKVFNLALKIYISYAVDFNKALYNQYFISLRHIFISQLTILLWRWFHGCLLKFNSYCIKYYYFMQNRHSLKILSERAWSFGHLCECYNAYSLQLGAWSTLA